MRAGCVYVLINTINGKRYVGQTVRSAKIRFSNHASAAKCGRNKRMPVVNAIRKYGREAFVIEQEIDCGSLEEMNDLECRLIDQLQTRISGYNIQTGGNALTEEDRERAAKTTRSKWKDPVFRAKQSRAISQGQNDPEAKQRMMEAQQIACNRPEAKKRLSKQWKKHWSDPEKRKKHSEAIQRSVEQPERRAMASETTKRAWSDSVKRARIEQGIGRSTTDRLKIKWKNEQVEIILPDGRVQQIMMYDLSSFCREHGLVYGNALKAYRGKISHTKKYRFRRLKNANSNAT